ncbi:MAG: hypothetical protein IJ049_03765 [Oscillospiraceae bacterium]|nr:hypothetical protein [Oscillospiraceae bacterium]
MNTLSQTKRAIDYPRICTASAIGALSIVFGTVLSNNINHQYLSPLMFSLGIILVIIFDLGLITRAVPSGASAPQCGVTAGVNFLAAYAAGWLLHSCGSFPDAIPVDFVGAIATGIVIGLVSAVNRHKSEYTVVVTIMLMFSFVYLHIPHCVVCAFYLGAKMTAVTLTDVLGLVTVIIGNILGGLVIRLILKIVAPNQV